MSAVSSRLTPRSSAACTVRNEPSPLCCELVYAQFMGMHPSPMAPTDSAPAPIVLRSTCPHPSRAGPQRNVCAPVPFA
ncbi:hypothetical protein GCM10023324_60390 [Streptomyces youssoufiensis]